MTTATTALEIADWRRQVFELYRVVRKISSTGSPVDAHEVWKSGRNTLFAQHPASPIPAPSRAKFSQLPVAAYDPVWRFEVAVEQREAFVPEQLEVKTGTDGIVPFERIGEIHLPHIGSLDLWRLKSYGGGIFLPVKDALAGMPNGTYGGGRYLLDTVKGADLGELSPSQKLIVDLNFAYNPSCAYDPVWACPLAPPGNTVAVEIPVGELFEAIM